MKKTRLTKTIAYRLLSMCGTMFICLLWTGEVFLSAGIAITSVVCKSVFYYKFDSLWEEEE